MLAAATLGTLVTVPNLPWYATLAKPGFNPPNAVFGPVWSLLYLGMAVALFRILGHPSRRRAKRGAIRMFLLQMLLNAVWSAAFFGLPSAFSGRKLHATTSPTPIGKRTKKTK